MKHTHTISGYLCMVLFALTTILAGCPPAPTTILTQSIPINKTLTLSFGKNITRINDTNKIVVYKQAAGTSTVPTKVAQDGFTATLIDGILVITLKDAIQTRDIAYVLLKTNAITYEGNVVNQSLVFMSVISRSYRLINSVSQAYHYISTHYYQEADEQAIINGTLKGMMNGLQDPYSEYIVPNNKQLYLESLTGMFVGVGLYIDKRKDDNRYIKVVAPIKGSPAANADIRAGDLITSIDGKNTEHMSTNDAGRLIRGAKGTKVTLTIQRNGKEPLTKIITRAAIQVTPVEHSLIDAEIAYLSIKGFNNNTAKAVKEALNVLNTKGYRTLIIDLRNNQGGLLMSAVDVANYFLGLEEDTPKKGTPKKGKLIVGQSIRGAGVRQEYRAGEGTLVPDGKQIVVMINKNTASAAEILTGAIRFNNRGILVGEKTFGKGVAQTLRDFRGGLIKLTTMKYYLAGRKRKYINKEGILPDIEIKKDASCPPSTITVKDDAVLQCMVNKIINGEVKKAIQGLPRNH